MRARVRKSRVDQAEDLPSRSTRPGVRCHGWFDMLAGRFTGFPFGRRAPAAGLAGRPSGYGGALNPANTASGMRCACHRTRSVELAELCLAAFDVSVRRVGAGVI